MWTRVAVVVVVSISLACGGGDPVGDALLAEGIEVRDASPEGDAWRWAGIRGGAQFCTGRVSPGLGVGPVRLSATFSDEVCDPAGGAVELAWTCDRRDDGIACREAGVLLDRAVDPAAATLLERACGLGEGLGCRLVGVGKRKAGDDEGARDWFERGCNLGEDRSCLQRGSSLAAPDDPLACRTDAHRWYLRGGPESKDAQARQEAECPDRDPTKARELWDESCRGGFTGGCRAYGYALVDGVGGPRDFDAGVAVFHKGCHAEPPDLQACVDFGLTLVATGKDQGGPRALSAFQKACDAGNAVGCRDVGVMLRDGQLGVFADGVAARIAFQKGCDGGDEPSCRESGVNRP